MQKNLSFQKKVPLLFSSILLLFFALLPVSSCKDGDEKSGDDKTVVAGSGFKMNCVILTKKQIQRWVDSGWTKPGDPASIKTILLQFFTADPAGINSNMQLVAYPGQTIMDVKLTGKEILAIDTTCVAKQLKDTVIFGNNRVNIADLKILEPNGTLNDFDYIRFIPSNGYPYYINFTIEVVRAAEKETIAGAYGRGSDPCPPYCAGPPPPVPSDE